MITRRTLLGSAASLPFLGQACAAQDGAVRANLYACEGCEGVYERNPETLTSTFDMKPEGEPGEAMILSGTVYKPDGKTPADGVILYFYHTNNDGLYANGDADNEWSRRHGHLRGWVKTGANGRYKVTTIKPAPYPNLNAPAHIHPTVLEPGREPYWIDDVVFDGKSGVTDSYKRRMTNKGGNGIITLSRGADGTWMAERDIILERHSN